MGTADPGWYPDASNGELLRWWDGRQWTSTTAPRPKLNPPNPSPVASGAQPVREYRRTCNFCGKTWHSLASREAQIEQIKKQAALSTIGNCCGDNSQNMRNIDAGNDSLTKLRQCPECGSSDYAEVIVGPA